MSSKNLSMFSYETLVHAISGSAGSVFAMTVFYPLDTIRSRLQIEDRESKSTLSVLLELAKEEGIETLYRGIIPVLKSLCASNFIYFYTFHGLKQLNGGKNGQNATKDLLIAALAGVVNVLTTTPLWVVNTRLKMKGIKNHKQNNYDGLLDGLLKIKKEEGIKALWNGTIPSLFLVANPTIQFVIYEAVKRELHKIYPEKKFGAFIFFLIGAFSKAVATVMTYPIQLLQTKLRHGHTYQDLRKNAGMNEVAAYILRKYGLSGLFKGMEVKILQTVLTAALMFTTYEKITQFVFHLMKTK
ncbi:Peroxisomal membrane protein PMP34, putative [Pediculus humanus corporis]|uniref:Peroxisomal membrane protein PMP34, putative n=1 Tax=Pediculus humanus subsp. corporis TaxID=121224 RepID=E0VAP9_PEDHC|nr:Peroxisomal membrane protein PMP34, putative [Pediculus humanus corporis]EEB10455.1 Peroxisomal membrane protein PMP34, putative [Pediculus humanus corporis]